jgi:hypothetical protein
MSLSLQMASEKENVEAQIKLEEFGGKILEAPLKNFEELFA